MRQSLLLILLGLFVLFSAGCTSVRSAIPGFGEPSPSAAVDPMDEVERRLLEVQRRLAVLEVELERLRDSVGSLQSTGASKADVDVRPREPGPSAVVEIPPSVELPTGTRVVEIQEAELPAEDLPSPVETNVEQPPAVDAATESRRPTPAAQAMYDGGYTLFHQGRYLDAETTFQRFLSEYGESELADNAQFWIGEARYARGDLASALAAFRETVNRYPRGNKVPDALLKVGDCLRGLGDLDGAQRSYRELIRDHPTTAAAAVAEDRIASLP